MNSDEVTQAVSTAISTSIGKGHTICDTSTSTATIFSTSDNTEMIRISQDGFYVRGVKLEQDETEARKLFDALMEFLMSLKTAAAQKAASEYICACGIRVTPHKCLTDNGF